jgi:hypothetical protein
MIEDLRERLTQAEGEIVIIKKKEKNLKINIIN